MKGIMLKWFIVLLNLCILLGASAQKLHADIGVGLVTYNGDLQLEKLRPNNFLPGYAIGVGYNLSHHFKLNGTLFYGKLHGDDKKSNKPVLVSRNLNFFSNIFEGSLVIDYSLFSDESPIKVTPFIFAGVGMYHFNPYTLDENGSKVYLQPLGTEGQGLPEYPDRKFYNLTQFSIPFGGGFRYRINDQISISGEANFRKLFTDYLDDVSATYADSLLLVKARGPLAVKYAFRKNEIDPTALYPNGSNRGNLKRNDTFYYILLKVSFSLFSGNGLFNSGSGYKSKSNVGCPGKVL